MFKKISIAISAKQEEKIWESLISQTMCNFYGQHQQLYSMMIYIWTGVPFQLYHHYHKNWMLLPSKLTCWNISLCTSYLFNYWTFVKKLLVLEYTKGKNSLRFLLNYFKFYHRKLTKFSFNNILNFIILLTFQATGCSFS